MYMKNQNTHENETAPCRFGDSAAGHDARYVERIIRHIHESCENGFSLSLVSKMENINKFNLIRKFKKCTGMTPYAFFMDIRMRRALALIRDPKLKIIDVGVLCGFENHSHFTRVFRQKIGMTPSAYRRSRLSDSASRDGPLRCAQPRAP